MKYENLVKNFKSLEISNKNLEYEKRNLIESINYEKQQNNNLYAEINNYKQILGYLIIFLKLKYFYNREIRNK